MVPDTSYQARIKAMDEHIAEQCGRKKMEHGQMERGRFG
jgi:hypothetical protein